MSADLSGLMEASLATARPLLEHFLRRLQSDPCVLQAAAHPGVGYVLNWAVDEIEHTASTLRHMLAEDVEYEMELVFAEIRERMSQLASMPRG